jgi:hypothetical protein
MRLGARLSIPVVILIAASSIQGVAAGTDGSSKSGPIRARFVGRSGIRTPGTAVARRSLSNIPAARLDRLHRQAASGADSRGTTSGGRTPTPITQFPGPTAGDGGPLASPSDSSGAIGPDFVVGTVNVVVEVLDTAGALQLGPLRLKSLFGGINGTDTDPKVIYDPYHDEFVLAFITFSSSSSQILVVEIPQATADDTGTWCGLVLNGDQTAGDGSQVADYTGLGFTANRVTVTTNQYQTSTLKYAFVQVLSFDAAELYDCNNPSPGYRAFGGAQTRDPDGSKAFTIQPAATTTETHSSPGTQFLTSFDWGGNTHASKLVLWRLRRVAGRLKLTNTDMKVGTVHVPPYGTQCNGSTATNTLWDTGDMRLINAYDDVDRNRVYTAHAVRHNFGAGANESAVRWYEIRPGGTLANSNVTRKGLVGEDAAYSGWPSIADNADGVLFVNYNQASLASTDCIGAWAATIPLGSTTPAEVEIKPGEARYEFSSGVERWGDYTQLNRDPSDTTRMGMFNAYALGTGGSTTALFQEWIVIANDV